jgi:anti-sigma B factor antagonist
MPGGLQLEAAAGGRDGQRVIRMTGSLALDTVPEFLKVIRAESAPVMILDFSSVSYIDSAGVGSLVQTFAAFKKTNRRMALTGVNERVRAVLEITRVQSLFPSFPTVAEAEQYLA